MRLVVKILSYITKDRTEGQMRSGKTYGNVTGKFCLAVDLEII